MSMQPTKLDVFQSTQQLHIEWPDGKIHELPFLDSAKTAPV